MTGTTRRRQQQQQAPPASVSWTQALADGITRLLNGLSRVTARLWMFTVAILFCVGFTLKFAASLGLVSQEFFFTNFIGPIQPSMQFVRHGLVVVQLGAMAWFLVGSQRLCLMLNIRNTPAWMRSVEQNAIQYSILIYIILPQFVKQFHQ